MKRIAWLDMLRGYALVCIMLDHMPVSVMRGLTLTNFVVFDAAELFVLLSGFLVGLVWLKVQQEQGPGAARKRFWRRALQVWLALIAGSIALALLSWLLFSFDLRHTAVWSAYSRMIAENPFGYVATIALMWMQPNLMDVLALYVVLIATVPLAMPVLLRHPFWFMAGSVALWSVALPLNQVIPNQRPGPGFLFNPFGWQLLFFCGAAMGAFRQQLGRALMPWARWLTALCVTIMLLGGVFVLATKLGETGRPVREAMLSVTGRIDKWSLDSVRLVSALAASWLVAVPLSGVFGRMAATVAGRALADIGKGGLWAFVACVLLSIFGDAAALLVPKETWPGWFTRLAVDIWVIVALWAMSVAWLRRGALIARYRNRSGGGAG